MSDYEFPEPAPYQPAENSPWDPDSVRSALTALTPDCADKTWATYIAALANAAREVPDRADSFRRVAIDWSSGKLQGRPAPAWTQAGPQWAARKDRFQALWERYLLASYQGRPVTVASIYFEARKAGWEPAVVDRSAPQGPEVKGQ